MKNIEILKELFKDNEISWYPFKEDVEYKIYRNFNKEQEENFVKEINSISEDTRIIITLENKLSIKGICQEINKDNYYNKKNIEELLNRVGLQYRKFYYVLPDLETANVIFTDKKLPDRETINRNISFYGKKIYLKNMQNELFCNLFEQEGNLFKIFANAFFIECSKNEFMDNGIEFVSYSNMRKEENMIQTIIKGENVYKKAFSEKSKKHIENIKKNIDILNKIGIKTLDSYNKDEIISKYQKNEKTLDRIIVEYLKHNEIKKVNLIVKELEKELKEKLKIINSENNVFEQYEIQYEKKQIENLNFVEFGLWDMIFQNIFYIDNEFYVFDQEWIDYNVPIEFIIYRCFKYNNQIRDLYNVEDLFREYNILQENIKLFDELDNKLQLKIRNEIGWKCHIEGDNASNIDILINNKLNEIKFNYEKKIQQINYEKQQQLNESIELLQSKDSRIKFLENNMENTCNLLKEKEEQLLKIENSKLWKITKQLRKIGGLKS